MIARRRSASTAPGSPALLVADQIGFSRGGRRILAGVSLAARGGEVVGVAGPSGSGKSTLLAMLAGLQTPDHGNVTLDGAAMTSGVPLDVGLVLQSYGLASVLTAAENVEITLQARGFDRAAVRAVARGALDRVGLAAVTDHLVEELSGGQQQRVAIARALVIEPRVLIADEMTAELDGSAAEEVLTVVRHLATDGVLVILATHEHAVAGRCDRVLHLVDGGLQAEGPS